MTRTVFAAVEVLPELLTTSEKAIVSPGACACGFGWLLARRTCGALCAVSRSTAQPSGLLCVVQALTSAADGVPATRSGSPPPPMRARFGIEQRLNYYPSEDLELIVHRTAEVLKVAIVPEGAAEISRRSRGTPRIANRLLRRVRDYAQVKGNGTITRDIANEALQLLDVDQFGLDDMDTRILKSIIEKFEGGPVGINTIAAAVGEDASTIEEVYEPYLIMEGYLSRTPQGRVVTELCYKRLGVKQTRNGQESLF